MGLPVVQINIFCFDDKPEMLIFWAILIKVEFPVVVWGGGGVLTEYIVNPSFN